MTPRKKSPAAGESKTGQDLSQIVTTILDWSTSKLIQYAIDGNPVGWIRTVEVVSKLRTVLLALAHLCDSVVVESDRIVDETDERSERIARTVRLRQTTLTVAARLGWFK
jgi:hypothetical protein